MDRSPVYEFIEYSEHQSFKVILAGIQDINPHFHVDVEVTYVVSGAGDVTINGDTIPITAEDVFYMNTNTVHSFRSTPGKSLTILSVQARTAFFDALGIAVRDYDVECNSAVEDGTATQEAFASIRQSFLAIIDYIRKNDEQSRLLVNAHILSVFSRILRHFPRRPRSETPQSEHPQKERISRIIEWLNQNASERFTLPDLADEMNMSVYHLCHLFKKAVGVPVGRYVTSIRLERVKERLLSDEDSVTSIALDCGFSNLGHFYKVFQSVVGCTPLQYRSLSSDHGARDEPTETLGSDAFHNSAIGNYLSIDRDAIAQSLPLRRAHSAAEGEDWYGSRHVRETSVEVNAYAPGVRFAAGRLNTITVYANRRPNVREAPHIETVVREFGSEYVRVTGFRLEGASAGKPLCGLIEWLGSLEATPIIVLSCPAVLGTMGVMEFPKPTAIKSSVAELEERLRQILCSVPDAFRGYWEISDLIEDDSTRAVSAEVYTKYYSAVSAMLKRLTPDSRVGAVMPLEAAAPDQPRLWSFFYSTIVGKAPLDSIRFRFDLSAMGGDVSSVRWPNPNYHAIIREGLKQAQRAATKAGRNEVPVHLHIVPVRTADSPVPHQPGFVAPLVIEACLELGSTCQSISFYSDICFDRTASNRFDASIGLASLNGLSLPATHGHWLLSRLGDECIYRGDNVIATRKGPRRIEILMWNPGSNGLSPAATGYRGQLDDDDAQDVYFHVDVHGLTGSYKAMETAFDHEHGCVLDRWLEIGAPPDCSEEELEVLRDSTHLSRTLSSTEYKGRFTRIVTVPPSGVRLIELYHVEKDPA